MANDYFAFKRFTVRQPRSAMRVGTDGVLLGAWCDSAPAGGRMLDRPDLLRPRLAAAPVTACEQLRFEDCMEPL